MRISLQNAVYAVAFLLSFIHIEGLQENVPIWLAEVWEIKRLDLPSTWKWLTSERPDRAASASAEWRAGTVRRAHMFGVWWIRDAQIFPRSRLYTKVVEVVSKWSRGRTWSVAVAQADQPGKYLHQSWLQVRGSTGLLSLTGRQHHIAVTSALSLVSPRRLLLFPLKPPLKNKSCRVPEEVGLARLGE